MNMPKKTRNCTASILGDSYSTFQGYIPEGQKCYYPRPGTVADVLCVQDTWWHMLASRRNLRILVNDSYSGATVCSDVREGFPPSSAFIARMKNTLSSQSVCGEKPDIIFIFGCSNDSFFNRTIGQVQFESWTDADLHQVLPAYCCLLDYVTAQNPDALVVTVVNDILNPRITDGMVLAAQHYRTLNVMLNNINKASAHPTRLGMTQICTQIDRALQLEIT